MHVLNVGVVFIFYFFLGDRYIELFLNSAPDDER